MFAATYSLLSLLLLCCLNSSAATTPAFNDEAVTRYSFTPRDCSDGAFVNRVGDSSDPTRVLIRNVNSTTCERSMGLHQDGPGTLRPGVWSSGTMADILKDSIDAMNGISIELWLKPGVFDPTDNEKHPILTIGRKDPNDPPPFWVTSCDTADFDFQLSERRGYLELAYRTTDVFIEPCQENMYYSFGQLESNKLTHIVVSLGDKKQQVFVNDMESVVRKQAFTNDLQHWSADRGLKLFGYEYPNPSHWKGSIYELAIYSRALSFTKAKQLIGNGLPSAFPFAVDYLVRINEDAEDVAGSHSLSWYENPPPLDDRSRFVLPSVSTNTEAKALQSESNVEPLNLDPRVYFYVTKLPSQGHLYQANGLALTQEDLTPSGMIPVQSEAGELVFVPPLHSHSDPQEYFHVFDNFTYCASDVPIFNSDVCESSVISITVDPVNDPPIANKLDLVTLQEGNNTRLLPKIPLGGTDVDIGDSIRRIQITQPPVHGDLILSVTTFRKDRLHHGTKLADLAFTVSGEDPVFVSYIREPDPTAPVVHGQTSLDHFLYRVQDQGGLWSKEEQVDLRVLTALSAQMNQTIIVEEDSNEDGNIKMYGRDNSGFNRRVGFLVESLPSEDKGILLQPITNMPVRTGSRINGYDASPYTDGVGFTFRPSQDFCHIQRLPGAPDAMVAFNVRVIAVTDESDAVVSVSQVYEQSIHVKCTHDEIVVKVPTDLFTTREFTLRRAASDPCRGSVTNTSVPLNLTICNASAIIHGIEVESRDRHFQKALVTVLPGKGYVTFNADAWEYAEPILGRRAVASKNVTFLAYPEDLTDVFADLHFHSYTPGVDTVELIVLYGKDCLYNSTESSALCQVVHKSIEIYVQEDETKYKVRDPAIDNEFPWQILLCLIVYPFLYYVFVRLEILAEGPSREGMPQWIQHQTAEGEFYYENTVENYVSWTPPEGEDYSAWRGE